MARTPLSVAFIKIAALVLLDGVASSHAQALPPGVQFERKGTLVEGAPDAQKYRFANGLRLLFVPDKRNPVSTLRIHLDAGSNREKPGITGLAHFFEHMMFRKTKDEPEGHFDKVLSGIGGSGNAATGTDFVVYESVFPGPALDIMLDLEAKRFMSLDLTDPYFTTEKGAVISERRMRYENNPQQRGFEFIKRITDRGTAREWLTIGTREDVENMKITDAQKFYQDFYVPDNALMTIGGPFEAEEVVEKVNKYFGSWKGSLKSKKPGLPSDILSRDAGKSFICREAVGEQVVQIVFPSKATRYEDLIMSSIVSELLDDSEAGDFSRRLNNKNLATGFGFYKMYWQFDHQPLAAYFSLSTTQDPDLAVSEFKQEIGRIQKLKWGSAFKKRLQKKLEVEKAEAAEKMTSLVEAYEFNETNYGDFLISKKYQSILDKLTPAQTQEWIRKNLDFSKAYLIGVSSNEKYPACNALTQEGYGK